MTFSRPSIAGARTRAPQQAILGIGRRQGSCLRSTPEDSMARILVLYGTTDGQTAKIARSIAEALRALGDDADEIEAGTAAPRPEDYAGVLVAASVRGGRYQRPVGKWVRRHATVLNGQPTAFVSVCLGVLQQDARVQQEFAAIIDRFFAATGWRPTVTKTVAGALAYTRYNPFMRWIMKRVAREAGGDTDTSRDHEYTDWPDVRAFAGEFSRRVGRGTSASDAAVTPGTRVA
jgi:menaquinone-dependent protoporphyrinogen oxidase